MLHKGIHGAVIRSPRSTTLDAHQMHHVDNLIDAERELDRRERRDERASAAYALLEREFEDALYECPSTRVSVFANGADTRPAVEFIADILGAEDDSHTLKQLLRICVVQARMGDRLAEAVLRGLIARYAEAQLARINEAGGFNDDE
jgi:hypothetical protein